MTAIDAANAATLDTPYLASTLGGRMTGSAAGNRRVRKPVGALYRETLAPQTEGGALEHTLRGRVWIDGPPVSLAEHAWRTAAAVPVRESGF